jgi:hypothetical protein
MNRQNVVIPKPRHLQPSKFLTVGQAAFVCALMIVVSGFVGLFVGLSLNRTVYIPIICPVPVAEEQAVEEPEPPASCAPLRS